MNFESRNSGLVLFLAIVIAYIGWYAWMRRRGHGHFAAVFRSVPILLTGIVVHWLFSNFVLKG